MFSSENTEKQQLLLMWRQYIYICIKHRLASPTSVPNCWDAHIHTYVLTRSTTSSGSTGNRRASRAEIIDPVTVSQSQTDGLGTCIAAHFLSANRVSTKNARRASHTQSVHFSEHSLRLEAVDMLLFVF